MELFEKINDRLGTSFKSDNAVYWYYIIANYGLDENFILDVFDKVDILYLLRYQKISENIIRKFSDEITAIEGWSHISAYQELSEDFMREFADKIDWFFISKYQKLSEDFIREFSDKVNWYDISKYQKLSDSFISEFRDILYMKAIEDNWIYKSAEDKKRMVQETGKYECYDEYFVAYKAIRADRYSLYNFQYKYEPNTEYESWCDCSDNENSFGLSVGTYDYTKWYLGEINGKIVRCKVKYEDIGRIVHDGEKIRCFKITPID